LDEVEIIHMNGRVYDYNVGRFLSVDPVIVDPTNTQAINPYSYVMNNPLAYTDPSGYACTQVTGTKFCAENISGGGPDPEQTAEQAVNTLQESQSQGNGAQNSGNSSNNTNSSADGDTTKINGQEDVAKTSTENPNKTASNIDVSNAQFDPRASKGATIGQMLELAWEQVTQGDVVQEAVAKTDEQYFGGNAVAESLGVESTINSAVDGVQAAGERDFIGVVQNAGELALNQIKLIKLPHGNSLLSPRKHHVYAIVDTTDVGDLIKMVLLGELILR
jgi:RHS repeat-associated protein